MSKAKRTHIPIRILIKDKEVYDFCKKDTKRINFFLEKIEKLKKYESQ
ncbi:plasmid partition family protein [Borreliella valaisiana]|nr:plasmid partition family protein [Borreliella valaisiana]WVN13758.1 plasmid partition family protein [Borreliella valaisiana]